MPGTPSGDRPDLERWSRNALLTWYDGNRRHLPWRAGLGDPPGDPPSDPVYPYRIWLSEIMLQQTTVAAVQPYYHEFLARWPALEALAAAPLEAVLAAWAGLGYYARARNLHACARAIVSHHGGRFPQTEPGLRALPGIGPYTAAAIAAIAFNQPTVAVDGNVERLVARLFGVTDPLPAARPRLAALARRLLPAKDPTGCGPDTGGPPNQDHRPNHPPARHGDFVQALIELGATVCTPTGPDCRRCPWSSGCVAARDGLTALVPVRAAVRPRPERQGVVYWLTDPTGRVLMRRRPERGLLGGMLEFPGSAWAESDPAAAGWEPPLGITWRTAPEPVRHVFTHFAVTLEVRIGTLAAAPDTPLSGLAGGMWLTVDGLGEMALPSVMRKVAARATTEPRTGRRERRHNREQEQI